MVDEEIQAEAPKMETVALVPAQIRNRVTVAPPNPWVTRREADESFRHAASNSVLLLDIQYNAAGNEYHHREVRRLETMKAVQELAQWKLNFDPGTQHVVIHSLTVIRDGARVDYAQVERFRFLQREGQMERSLSIDGSITVVVIMEDVRIGDIIDLGYTIRTTPRVLAHRSSFLTVVPSYLSVRAYHINVRFPAGSPMRWKSNDQKFTPEIREIEGGTEWSWKRENLRPIDREAGVPSWHIADTWVQVSDCESWAEVAAGVASEWKEEFTDPALQRQVEEINASKSTPAERAARAIEFVQDDIRYLSLDGDLGGQIPSSPGIVLQRRFGDCKDKSFLLAHMLRLLGISAQPVLVNTYWRQSVGQLLPTHAMFNHVIVHYEIDGQSHWVDATITLQSKDPAIRTLPDYRLGLPVSAGATELQAIEQSPGRDDHYELREEFILDSRPGQISTLQVTIRARGSYAEDLRRNFAHNGQLQVAYNRTQFYKQRFPTIKRVGALQWRDDREDNELVLAEMYNITDLLIRAATAKRCLFRYNAHLIQSALGYPEGTKRQHPFVFPFPCSMEHCIDIVILESVGKIMPKVMRKTPAFHYSRENSKSFNRFSARFALQTLTDHIMPAQYEAHKKAVKELWAGSHFQFQFPIGLAAPPRKPKPDGNLLPAPRKRSDTPLFQKGFGKGAKDGKLPPFQKKESASPAATNDSAAPSHESRRRKSHKSGGEGRGFNRRKILIALAILIALIAWAALTYVLCKS